MDDSPIALPALPPPPTRAPLPWLAATVPLVGGVALWAVTGSPFSLLFALLGPVVAVASMLDTARGSRRTQRVALARHADEVARAEQLIVARLDQERSQLLARHPDVLQLASSPDEVWRAAAAPGEGMLVARGVRPSACRVAAPGHDGGGVDASADVARLRALAATLSDAPITAPLGGGAMICGPDPLAIAAARALVLQLCLAHGPDELQLEALPQRGWEWAGALPHVLPHALPGAATRARGAGARHPLRVAVVDVAQPAGPVDRGLNDVGVAGELDRSLVHIAYGPVGTPADPRSALLITVHGADGAAQFTTARALDDVRVQLIGEAQARVVAASLAKRATAVFPAPPEEAPPPSLEALLQGARSQRVDGQSRSQSMSLSQSLPGTAGHPIGGALPVPIGSRAGTPVSIDIVGDGPHALVVGMTGSGKSEMLVSWITALAALYPPESVVFLLADFKGGTTFAPLVALPHVVGVISDLEAAGAARALQSLRAEIRWREARLAAVGARDIADGLTDIPRLLVVIDEFATLLAQHPELHELFVDLAARGRALGMHLILGTQRASGSVRDGLLANLSLRVCLRVVDESESRAVIGAPGAALLSAAQPGAALVRRPRDDAPVAVRVARASLAERDQAACQWASSVAPRRPWLPPLPRRLDAATLALAAHHYDLSESAFRANDGLVLGLIDEPAAQRQRPWIFSPAAERSLLVIGGPGSGKTGALRSVSEALRRVPVSDPANGPANSPAPEPAPECVWVPTDPEGAWDAVAHLAAWPPPAGAVVIIDNLDVVIAGFPADYASVFIARLEALLREGGSTGIAVVASAQRMPIAGTRIGELFHTRLVLGLTHRADHLAAGAEGATFATGRPAGRGVIRGLEVQLVEPSDEPDPVVYRGPGTLLHSAWQPAPGLVGIVCRAPAVLETVLREAWSAEGAVIVPLRSLQPGTRAAELAEAGDGAVVVIGDADAWQQHWSLLAAIRAGHPLIVDAASPGEFRALTGMRELPPYVGGDASWLCAPDGSVSRVSLPQARQRSPWTDALGRTTGASSARLGA